MEHLVEHHEASSKHANHEEVGNSHSLANEVPIRLEVVVRELAMPVQGSQAVIAVGPDDGTAADQWEDAAADRRQKVRVDERHPFEDVQILSPGRSEKRGGVTLRRDFCEALLALHGMNTDAVTVYTYCKGRWGCIR